MLCCADAACSKIMLSERCPRLKQAARIVPDMDLFNDVREKNLKRVAPLAVRMRPRNLDEFVGQQHFLGPGKLLRRMLEADRLTSVIFYGPPGTGKTTLASIIAQYTSSHFEQVNAAGVGVKEVRAIMDAAKDRLGHSGQRTVLFIDEITASTARSRMFCWAMLRRD